MNKELEARNEVLFAKLVPFEGRAETLEGETLRAINRIVYRYYNDGDYWYEGYGCETAGPAEAFLREYSPVNVMVELQASEFARDEAYEEALESILEKILTHLEGVEKLTPSNRDMYSCDSKYEEEEEEEEDYDYC